MFYAYILINQNKDRTYTGVTNNIEKRLIEHNAGQCYHTKKFRPWDLFCKDKFLTFAEARKREKYLKTYAGRKFIKKLFNPE